MFKVSLAIECADVVVVERKLLQLQTAVQTLHFRNFIIIEGGPAQVDQFIQIIQFGNPLVVQSQSSDLVKTHGITGSNFKLSRQKVIIMFHFS